MFELACALTRNQHGGDDLRGFQEVHVPPLEALAVVGLQVTGQKQKHTPLILPAAERTPADLWVISENTNVLWHSQLGDR